MRGFLYCFKPQAVGGGFAAASAGGVRFRSIQRFKRSLLHELLTDSKATSMFRDSTGRPVESGTSFGSRLCE